MHPNDLPVQISPGILKPVRQCDLREVRGGMWLTIHILRALHAQLRRLEQASGSKS